MIFIYLSYTQANQIGIWIKCYLVVDYTYEYFFFVEAVTLKVLIVNSTTIENKKTY